MKTILFAVGGAVAGIFIFGVIYGCVLPEGNEVVRTLGSLVAAIVGVGVCTRTSERKRVVEKSNIKNQKSNEPQPLALSERTVRMRGAIVLLCSLVVGSLGVAGMSFEVAINLSGILIVVSSIAALVGLLGLTGGKGLTA